MKRALSILAALCVLLTMLGGCAAEPSAPALPPPEPDPESRFGVDARINMTTIDQYLNRADVCYRDVRMLFDPADYAAIGGEANLTRTITGFKVVPYPFLATLTDLPVSGAYGGPCLFALTWDADGQIMSATPNYQESALILEELFPKDKAIFLMCGGGGYAGMMKALLTFLGWDANLLYNVGGNWSYEGANRLELIVYPEDADGELIYATWRADYATLAFDRLNPVKGA